MNDATPNVTDMVTFTVTLRNAGPSATTGVALVDAIPAGLTLLSATPSAGAYDTGSGAWTVGNLAVNQTVTLAVQARVDASGGITNTATVTASDLYDPDTSNNTAGASVNTPAAADIRGAEDGRPARRRASTPTWCSRSPCATPDRMRRRASN